MSLLCNAEYVVRQSARPASLLTARDMELRDALCRIHRIRPANGETCHAGPRFTDPKPPRASTGRSLGHHDTVLSGARLIEARRGREGGGERPTAHRKPQTAISRLRRRPGGVVSGA